MRDLIPLPGTEYSRYALPLEYPPSRDLRPRWGYGRPPIAALYSWLAEHADAYRSFLGHMRTFGPDLTDVPYRFDPARLPLPGWTGVAMNPIDLLTLYTFVRKYRPATYIEIGSGVTTCFMHLARQHGQLATRIVSIDPEPRLQIDAICDDVIRSGLESCDISIFETLAPNDIVFVDGSHRSFMNSDVTVFFIDVLPLLHPGVLVHLHDISLPWDYHEFFTNWYWNEQYLLAVYLMGNRRRIAPLFPAAFVTRDPMFAAEFSRPLVNLPQDFSLEGGSMWFTHTDVP